MVYLTFSQLPFSPAQDNTYHEHRCQLYNLIFPNQRQSQSAHTAFKGTAFCDKYLRSWYPNFAARAVRHRVDKQHPLGPCSSAVRHLVALWGRRSKAHLTDSSCGPMGRPYETKTSPCMEALGFKACSPALTTALVLRRKPSARPRWPKPSLSCWCERRTPEGRAISK